MAKLLSRFFKKPWDKEECNFVVQVYGRGGGRGWEDITDPSGEIPNKKDCMDLFEPGFHYRVLARYISGDNAGRLAGVPWKHYESLPGGLKPKEKPKVKKEREAPKKVKMSEVIDGYIEEVDKVLSPMAKLADVFEKIRTTMGVNQPPPQQETGAPSGMGVPPLEFDGKAPWWMHPYIVHSMAEEAKSVIEYGADRLEGILGPAQPEVAPPAEEEEIELPTLPPVEVEEEEEEKPPTEAVEKMEKLPEVPPEEKEVKEKKEEPLMTVPSLVEEEKPAEEKKEKEPEKVIANIGSNFPRAPPLKEKKKRRKKVE